MMIGTSTIRSSLLRNRFFGARLANQAFVRCKSKTDKSHKKNDKELTSNDANNNKVSDFKVKSTSSPASPAPMDPNSGISHYLKKDNKPYIPKLKHERLSFEYPGLPNQDDFTKHTNEKKPKVVNRWSRYFPKIITGVVVLWGAYAIKVWIYLPEPGSDSQELLDPREFHRFIITHKEEIDDQHFLIELVPKFNHWQYSFYSNYESKSIWNGDKIWSVDVKQPDIMVVRAYTPLPLYFMKSEYTRSGDRKPLLKVINNDADDYDKQGSMCLYVKKYNDGEVSRYIANKKIGEELELRGPNIEYKFPYHPLKQFHERPIFRDLPSKIEPENLVEKIKKVNKLAEFDNLVFYAAGTGITPILQVLLSRNPYRGFVDIHYSAQKQGELKPLERFLFFLEKLDRIKLHTHYDNIPNSRLNSKDVTKPEPSEYTSPLHLEEKGDKSHQLSPEEAYELRMQILNGDKKNHKTQPTNDDQRVHRYENAIEQAIVTSKEPKKPASLSLVCGPDGYIDYVAGSKHAEVNEQGPIKGLLGEKGWDNDNTYKL